MSERQFSESMFGFYRARDAFEEALDSAGFGDFEGLGGDDYDNSLEILGVSPQARLSEAAQRVIFEAGFSKVYVNHTDGWMTHHSWGKEFEASPGWRRRYVKDPTAKTTRLIGEDPPEERGYFEISFWPEGWGDQETGKCAQWLKSGYMRIVPDDRP